MFYFRFTKRSKSNVQERPPPLSHLPEGLAPPLLLFTALMYATRPQGDMGNLLVNLPSYRTDNLEVNSELKGFAATHTTFRVFSRELDAPATLIQPV